MKRAHIRSKVGVFAAFLVTAVIWPVVGAAPIPLAAGYLTAADCTKTAAAGTHGWNTAATWTPTGVPAATDVVCLPDGATVNYDVPAASGDQTVIGIVATGVNGSGTLSLGFSSTSNLILSGGATADKASTIGHLNGNGSAGGELNAVKIAGFPHIIRFLDSCGINGPGDFKVTDGGVGGPCFLTGTGTPSPTLTLAAGITPTGQWALKDFQLVINSGVAFIEHGNGMTLEAGSVVDNHGTIDFNPGATDPDAAWTDFDAAGNVVINRLGGVIDKATAGTSGTTKLGVPLVNDGTVLNESPGTLVIGGPNNLGSPAGAVVIGGPVSGTGTIADDVLHTSGALSPGHSAGSMAISGGYTVVTGLNAGPSLAIEDGGVNVGQADLLNVGGACTLDGTLVVTLTGGYTPTLGDTIAFMICSSVVGTFASEVLPSLPPPLFFDVVYSPSTVYLEVKAATAVTFRSFTATRARAGVNLHWRTGTESDLLGFNVYRGGLAARHRLNSHLILGHGQAAGGAYSFLDRHAARGAAARYWLEVVDRSGTRSWHGPVRPQRG